MILPVLFFIIAMIYSMAGFGGGSTYLAILVLAGLDYNLVRSGALLCNLSVTAWSTYAFFKWKIMGFKEASCFVVLSVPLAFLGGSLRISEQTFFILLGLALVIAGVLLWTKNTIKHYDQKSIPSRSGLISNIVLGGGIGFFSGLVGIGGGIFLSPVLSFINWGPAKKIAGIASFFIFVNSLAGISGFLYTHQAPLFSSIIPWLLISVLTGGVIGNQLNIKKFNQAIILKITAILILFVGFRILIQYLFSN